VILPALPTNLNFIQPAMKNHKKCFLKDKHYQAWALETLAEGKIIWRWERQKIQGGK
jgi:hypothetical protein